MGYYLRIQKIKSMDDKHFYHVIPLESKDFFIEIDVLNKKIIFYLDKGFSNPLGSMNLLSGESFIDIPGIDYKCLVTATVQAARAVNENSFPEFISKQS